MATNTYLTIGDMSKEVLMLLTGELSFAKNVSRQYDSRFANTGAKIGATANIRVAPKFTVGTTAAVTAQDYTEKSVPVVCDTLNNVAIEFTSSDLSLSLDDFSNRFLKPAAGRLASEIDKNGLTKMYKNVWNQSGTPGTAFTSLDLFYDAFNILQDNLVPIDGLKIVAPSRAITKASQLMMNLFAPKSGDDIIKNYVASALGFDWYISTTQVIHQVGTHGASAKTINGAGQTGSTLSVTGYGLSVTGAAKQGDIFTIAGVYAVHPLTKVTLNTLQQFVVTADAASNGSGVCSLSISPAIVTTGAYQNVSAGPASGATVTVAGASATTYPVALAFQPDAFALVTVNLQSVAANTDNISTMVDEETGIALTVEKFRNGQTGTDLLRVDVLYGWSAVRPEMACRIATA